jgi:hypothetical protein
MKRDIKDFVSQKRRSTVNKLPGCLEACPPKKNLFVMYAKARFQIKFVQTKSYDAHCLFDNF